MTQNFFFQFVSNLDKRVFTEAFHVLELDQDRLFFETGPRSGQRAQKYRRLPKPVIILKISDQLFPGYLTKTLSFGPKL